MIPLNHVVSALLFSCALYAMLLSLYTFRKMRPRKVGPALVLLMFASVFYSMGYGLELFSGDPGWTFACLRVQYVGLAFMPYLILRLALEFTGLYRRYRKVLLAPLAIGVVAFAAVQTNALHGLFYTLVGVDSTGPFPTSALSKGPIYALHMTSFVVSCLAAFLVYMRLLLAPRGIESNRLYVLASTTVFPLVSIALYLFGIVPWHLDPSPVSALICSVLMIYGIQRTGLLELEKRARDLVFSSMREAVIVTSKPDTITEYNEAARRVFPELARDARGLAIGSALPCLAGRLPAENDSLDYTRECRDAARGDTDAERGAAEDVGPGRPIAARRRRNKDATVAARDTRYEVRNVPVVDGRGRVLGNAYIFRDVTREREYLESLKKRALIDGLTELNNRDYWEELAAQALRSSIGSGGECAFLMFDIDRFKDINDSFGHDAGDNILRSMSRRVRSSLRENDVAGRYGGDEFCLCLPNTGMEDCLAFSEGLRRDISSISISAGGVNTPVTVSVGIAVASPGDDVGVTRCMARADQALYRAKRNGRNRIERYEGD